MPDSKIESNNSMERTDSNTSSKSKHSMVNSSRKQLPRSESGSNSNPLKSNEHQDITWDTKIEQKNESTKSFIATVSSDELQVVKATSLVHKSLNEQGVVERIVDDITFIGNSTAMERPDSKSKSNHSMISDSREKLARSKTGSNFKSLKSVEHLDFTWDTELEEKVSQSSIVKRTEIDSTVPNVNESTKSFRAIVSNDEVQVVKATSLARKSFNEQDVVKRIVDDIIGNLRAMEKTDSKSKSKHSMVSDIREKLARSKTGSNSKSLKSKEHLDITWNTELEEKVSQSSIAERTEIDSMVLNVNESTKSFRAIISNDELQVVTDNTGSKSKSKHSMISDSREKLARSKTGSNSKSLKPEEHLDFTWDTELEEKVSQSSIVKRTEIDSTVPNVNESTKSFRAMVSNDEVQVVKATSLARKSFNEQDVVKRIVDDIIGNLRAMEKTDSKSKSKHSMVSDSREKLARSKTGSNSKSLKSKEHLDITWNTELEEKVSQSSIAERTEIDSMVLNVNESTKSFRAIISNDELQVVTDNTGSKSKSKHSMISDSREKLTRSKTGNNSKSLKPEEHLHFTWDTELEEKVSQSSIAERTEIDSMVLNVNESTKSFRAIISNDELQVVTDNTGSESKSKHSIISDSREKLARSKTGSNSKSLKPEEHLDFTWDTELEEKVSQSSIVKRTEIDSTVPNVNESTKSFRAMVSNDEVQVVKATSLARKSFNEQDVVKRTVDDIIGNLRVMERTDSKSKSKHSMISDSREKLARSKTGSNSKSLKSREHHHTWDTDLKEKDSQSSIVKRTEIVIDSTVLHVNESKKSLIAKATSLARKSLDERIVDITLIDNSRAMERSYSTVSKSKHSFFSASRAKLAGSKTGSKSKSLKSKEHLDITWNTELEEKDSQSFIVKRTEIEIDSTVLNVNESTRRFRATSSNEELQVIKATSLGREMSVNDQDTGVRIVDGVTISMDRFGLITTDTSAEVVKRFTFTNKHQMQVQIITLGATVTKILVPDKNGVFEDIALGFDTCEDYLRESNPNIGCTLGRDAFETLQDEHYNGLGNLNWLPSLDEGKLILTHVSEDGWHGYRGTVMIRAIFELRQDNSFHVTYWATTTINTPINLSLNLFLNLGGHSAKRNELYKHIFTINGDRSIQERTYRLSKFKAQSVGGTVYDLRIPKEIGPVIGRSPHHGFDKYYILTKGTEQTMAYAARVIHPNSGRTLEVYTDRDGIQFYTSDYFPDLSSSESIPVEEYELSDEIDSNCESSSINNSSKTVQSHRSRFYEIKGKNGAKYGRHDAFCINSLNLPSEDAKNLQKNVLIPGRIYSHRIIYKFGVLKIK